jgi:CBS domain-containing protein
MIIENLMHQPAITCHPNDSLEHAASLMWDHDCGALAVVDEEGKLTGVITDRDICMGAYTQGRTLDSIPVAQAMAKHAIACSRSDSIESIERLMSEHQIRRVPVVEGDGRVVGMLSLADLARQAASGRGEGPWRQLADTFYRITRPRPARARAAE